MSVVGKAVAVVAGNVPQYATAVPDLHDCKQQVLDVLVGGAEVRVADNSNAGFGSERCVAVQICAVLHRSIITLAMS